jgi:hypothetical protein
MSAAADEETIEIHILRQKLSYIGLSMSPSELPMAQKLNRQRPRSGFMR